MMVLNGTWKINCDFWVDGGQIQGGFIDSSGVNLFPIGPVSTYNGWSIFTAGAPFRLSLKIVNATTTPVVLGGFYSYQPYVLPTPGKPSDASKTVLTWAPLLGALLLALKIIFSDSKIEVK